MDLRSKTLLTDFYQLTMVAAYYYHGKHDQATFDLHIRRLPEDWGYFIANGIEDAVDYITSIAFTDDDCAYLKEQGFKDDFLQFLQTLRFEGDVWALREGTPFFPGEPFMRVTAPLTQSQLIETALLNIVNFQTMIATKTSRIVTAADPSSIVDFGLRRSHEEDAGNKGARAAYIAGAASTSNVKAGKMYGIPISGTHAHSFVMSFDEEIEAFRSYADTFPDNAILLIDTYDTLRGAENAAIVAKELEQKGQALKAVRLDSGNLAELAQKVRRIFDDRGQDYIKIVASGDLNEYRIAELKSRSAPIDLYGVGTELITAKPVAAVSGVYKLAEGGGGPKIKLSEGKQTLPGKKQIYRAADDDGTFREDIIAMEDENVSGRPLLEPVIRAGERTRQRPPLEETRQYCLSAVSQLPQYLRDVYVKKTYPVRRSDRLQQLVERLTSRYAQGRFQK